MLSAQTGGHDELAQRTRALWQAYAHGGDVASRDQLILILLPMVRSIVARKLQTLGDSREADDYLSVAVEALIRAVDRFDPDKGATLPRFIWQRVSGAMLDALRRDDWAPRTVRSWVESIDRARREFVRHHGRFPTNAELADAMSLHPRELLSRLDRIALFQVQSLNVRGVEGVAGAAGADGGAGDDDEIELVETLCSDDTTTDPEAVLSRKQASEALRQAFADLPERERTILSGIHMHGRTARELAAALGVSESRISQLQSRALKMLRAQLEDDVALFLEPAA